VLKQYGRVLKLDELLEVRRSSAARSERARGRVQSLSLSSWRRRVVMLDLESEGFRRRACLTIGRTWHKAAVALVLC
jgi:hypothetical protein